jgi:hypothetical protein
MARTLMLQAIGIRGPVPVAAKRSPLLENSAVGQFEVFHG